MNDRFSNTKDTINEINSRIGLLHRKNVQGKENFNDKDIESNRQDPERQENPKEKLQIQTNNNRGGRRKSRLRSEQFLK